MKIRPTPTSVRKPYWNYPAHSRTGVEHEFCLQARRVAHLIPTKWIYLPIMWTANYGHSKRGLDGSWGPISDVTRILKTLNEHEHYFTVVQNDDGPYEAVPENVTVFSAGGVGDIPIPLLCSLPEYKIDTTPRPLLCSFLGRIRCGGPVRQVVKGTEGRSSWDPTGAGYSLRTEMMEHFRGKKSVEVWDIDIDHIVSREKFLELGRVSKFTLCPRGYGKTSFRLYEAMWMGSVPVYIYDDPWLPYTDKLDWSKFCVLCHRSEIPTLYDRLRSISDEEWTAMRMELDGLLGRYFSFGGMSTMILDYVLSETTEVPVCVSRNGC